MTPEERIQNVIDQAGKALEKAFLDLTDTITDLVFDLSPITGDKGQAQKLAEAEKVRQAIFNEMAVEFPEVAKKLNYQGMEQASIDIINREGVVAEYIALDRKIFAALQEQIVQGFTAISSDFGSQIANDVYNYVLLGGKKRDFIDQIKNKLVGLTDKAGRPLATYAETYAKDSLMEYYGTITKKKAESVGFKKWKYVGTVKKTTRKWCRDHVGNTYTTEEIEGFRDDPWAGKKEGDVFIVCGGYGCRHHWTPVRDK